MADKSRTHLDAAIIGAGPAGLMAAEVLAREGVAATIYERMPSPARKFLLAGRGGLNITHSEPFESFVMRYGTRADVLRPVLQTFSPGHMRAFCKELGEECFTGSSGRVFPASFKTSPLLRAWLQRLESFGVRIAYRHRLTGWRDGALLFDTPDGAVQTHPDVTILALGGASWPRLGSTGEWVEPLRAQGVEVADLAPANCGFESSWSDHLRERFSGVPLKNIALKFGEQVIRGECILTGYGLEGGAIYALSGPLREAITREGKAEAVIDLKPDTEEEELARRLARPRGSNSVSNHLRKSAGLTPAMIALLREPGPLPQEPPALAHRIKNMPLTLTAARPLDRAISTAGGVRFEALDRHFMLKAMPGVFASGEMLDWEAPTGGYLLQASFATGAAAARGALQWLAQGETEQRIGRKSGPGFSSNPMR